MFKELFKRLLVKLSGEEAVSDKLSVELSLEPGFVELYNKYAKDKTLVGYLEIDGISPDKLDVAQMSKNYFTSRMADVSIDTNANANESISPNSYAAQIVKGLGKLEGYNLLWRYSERRYGRAFADEAMEAIWQGKLYFHDSSGVGLQVPYCISFSTSHIMLEGLPYGQLHSLPPKRSDTFIAQVTEAVMHFSQEFVGAVAPADLIANACYFFKTEGYDPDKEEDAKYIINQLQKFVHIVNSQFRTAGESPFTNVSIFDRTNLEKLFGDKYYIDGSKADLDYIMKVQKLFARWFSLGDVSTGLPFRFPVVTMNIAVDEERNPVDEDFFLFVCDVNRDKACFNIYANEGTKIASCCRLVNDTERMKFRADSFGNGGLNIGSARVCTVNLPAVALDAVGDMGDFWKILQHRMMLARKLLTVHREEILKRRIDSGFLKFFRLKWVDLSMFFATFGITGIHEMCEFMGMPITTEGGQEFTANVLKTIEAYADMFSEEDKWSYNCEEIPGEQAAISLAKKDAISHPRLQLFPLYSNQYLPLIANVDMVDRIKLSGKFMSIVSGGGIVHLNLEAPIDSIDKMGHLLRMSFKAGVEHMAINYGFGICKSGHTSVVGNKHVCPVCGDPIEDYLTRVIGYFTKISSWNAVRKNFEYPKRKFH